MSLYCTVTKRENAMEAQAAMDHHTVVLCEREKEEKRERRERETKREKRGSGGRGSI